jgi:hypothetical protein
MDTRAGTAVVTRNPTALETPVDDEASPDFSIKPPTRP